MSYLLDTAASMRLPHCTTTDHTSSAPTGMLPLSCHAHTSHCRALLQKQKKTHLLHGELCAQADQLVPGPGPRINPTAASHAAPCRRLHAAATIRLRKRRCKIPSVAVFPAHCQGDHGFFFFFGFFCQWLLQWPRRRRKSLGGSDGVYTAFRWWRLGLVRAEA